jgi:plasmid maintenance system antidote protein VapI
VDLEAYRKRQDLTYQELADHLGLTLATTYRICKHIGCINLATAHRIVKLTGGMVFYTDLLTAQEAC